MTCGWNLAIAPENILTRDGVNTGRSRRAVGRRYVGRVAKQWADCCDVEKWMRCCGECRKMQLGGGRMQSRRVGVVEGERDATCKNSELR